MTGLGVWYLLCNFYMDNLLSLAHCERQSCETDSSALLRGYIIQLTSEYHCCWEAFEKDSSAATKRNTFFPPLPRTEENQAENKCKKIRKEYKSTSVSTEHLSLAPGVLRSQRQWSCKRIPPGEGEKKNKNQSFNQNQPFLTTSGSPALLFYNGVCLWSGCEPKILLLYCKHASTTVVQSYITMHSFTLKKNRQTSWICNV